MISIITLMAGILLPSVKKARDLARKAACLANVRRLATSAQLYVTNNNQTFPPHRLSASPGDDFNNDVYVNEYGRKRPRWHWFLSEGAEPPIDPTPYVSNQGDTFDDFDTTTMTNEHFLCPSLDGEGADSIRDGAYGYNHAYLGCGIPLDPDPYKPANFPVKATRIRVPGSTVIFADSRGAIDSPDMSIRKYSYTLDSPKMALSVDVNRFGPLADSDIPAQWSHSPAHARHLGVANVSFVDGHAASKTVEELGYRVDSDGIVIRDAGDNRFFTGTGEDEP